MTESEKSFEGNLVKKAKLRPEHKLRVGTDFYDKLDQRIMELVKRAEIRAEENDRKTVYPRDL